MGTGNTEGRIVGQPSVPEKKAQEANPAVSAENEEEKGFLASLFDIPLNSRIRGRWLAISALYHGQYESFRSIAEGFGDEALAGFDGTYDNADVQLASVVIDISGTISSGGTGTVRRTRRAGSAEKGRFRGIRSPAQTPVLAGAGGMPYGEGIEILNAERRAAGSSVKNADTTAESPIQKTESGGKSKGIVRQKPHRECGRTDKYKVNYKEKNVMNADHTPSGAALRKAAENKLKVMGVWNKMTDKERKSVLNKVYNDAPTISIPEDIHMKGRTYAGKNKSTQSSADAKDLNGAFKRDTQAIQKQMDMSETGCSGAYKKAVERLSNMDWDKYITDIVSSHKNVKPFLK